MSAAPRKRKPATEREGSKDRDAARVRSASTGGAKRASAYDAQPEGRPSGTDPAEAGESPAQRAAAATPGQVLQPPHVSRGLKTQLPTRTPPLSGVFVRLDWIRATGPEDMDLDNMLRLCRERFGDAGKRSNGAAFFTSGRSWRQGAQVSWGHSAKLAMIDLRGELLSSMSGNEGIDLLREVWNRCWKVTRIDGALDFIGQERSVVDNARASCLSEELCRLRWFKENFGGRSVRDRSEKCVNLGRRDAEACVRIYDKGLEQKWGIANWWERIETEWKGEKAFVVAQALAQAGADWTRILTERILGAFDFRENNGRSELARRPRVKWWADLLDGLEPVSTPPTSRDVDLLRWIEGVRRSYGGVLLAMKEAAGWTWEELGSYLLGGVDPNRDSPVLRQFMHMRTMSTLNSI